MFEGQVFVEKVFGHLAYAVKIKSDAVDNGQPETIAKFKAPGDANAFAIELRRRYQASGINADLKLYL